MFAEQHFNPLNNIYKPIALSIADSYYKMYIYSYSSINIAGKEYWLNHHCDNLNDELKKYCYVSKFPVNGQIKITTPNAENTHKLEEFEFNTDYFKKNPTNITINGIICAHGVFYCGRFHLNNSSCIIKGYTICQNNVHATYNSRILLRLVNSCDNIIVVNEILCSDYIFNDNFK